MKALTVFFATLGLSLSTFAANEKLVCTYYPGGYDVETIEVSLNGAGEVLSLEYVDYQGGSTFLPQIKAGVFEKTPKTQVLNYIVSLSPEKDWAVLTLVYKDSGKVLDTNFFKCQ